MHRLTKYLRFIFVCYFLYISIASASGQEERLNIFEELDADIQKSSIGKSDSLIKCYSSLRTITIIERDIAKNRYTTEFMKYYINNFAHRKSIFEWQLLSSKFIFFLVMIVVLSGILFSGLQFYQSFKLTSKFTKMANSKNLDQIEKIMNQDSSTIEISPTNGFSVTTSIVGLLVLGVSIGFFYLYLNHVYPINEKQMDNPSELNLQINEKKETAPGLDPSK